MSAFGGKVHHRTTWNRLDAGTLGTRRNTAAGEAHNAARPRIWRWSARQNGVRAPHRLPEWPSRDRGCDAQAIVSSIFPWSSPGGETIAEPKQPQGLGQLNLLSLAGGSTHEASNSREADRSRMAVIQVNRTVNPGQSTRAAAADLGVDQSTVVRARRGAEASPETVTGRRSNLSAGSGAASAATG